MGKDVTIHVPVAQAFAGGPTESVRHLCPLCDQTFPDWETFKAHAKGCVEAHPEKVREIQGKEE